MTVRIITGDCRDVLRSLPSESVHCVVTSPPYWGLRDYGVLPSIWGGDDACEHSFGDLLPPKPGRGNKPGDLLTSSLTNPERQDVVPRAPDSGAFCQHCAAWRGAHGLEPLFDLFVRHEVMIFAEVRRVLRPDGTLWLNLGDSYATGAGKVVDSPGGGEQGARWKGGTNSKRPAMGKHTYADDAISVGPGTQPNRMPQPGLKPKDLCGIPWRVAFALQADGWWLRQDIVWSKPNPMPESVTDRCTKAHEYLFLLSKSERYHFDQEAILEPISEGMHLRVSQVTLDQQAGSDRVPGKTNGPMKAVLRKMAPPGLGIKNNERMDAALVHPGRRSGNKERKDRPGAPAETGKNQKGSVPWEGYMRNKRSVWTVTTQPFSEAHFATFPPALIEPCVLAGCPEGGTVLDPFGGAGTTGLVADRLRRHAILIELNPEYAAMARRRIVGDNPLFSTVAVE